MYVQRQIFSRIVWCSCVLFLLGWSFTGQIFAEVEPHGEIKEKIIDGSSC